MYYMQKLMLKVCDSPFYLVFIFSKPFGASQTLKSLIIIIPYYDF